MFRKESAIALGHNNYKIRLRCSDLKRGKSKSFRLILHILEEDRLMVPISLYFKSNRENLSKKEIMLDLADAVRELEMRRN